MLKILKIKYQIFRKSQLNLFDLADSYGSEKNNIIQFY